MTDAAQEVSDFCAALIGGPDGTGDDRLSGYRVSVWTLPDKRTRWVPADQPGSLASAILRASQRAHAVYVGMGLVSEEIATAKETTRRATAADVAGILAFWADLDIQGHGHKKDGLFPTRHDALATLAATGVAPTVVVDTGYGIQPWWRLAEPLIFEDADERDDIAGLVRDWTATIRVRAHTAGGWGRAVDATHNLDRLMRAPGSYNTKDADGCHHAPTADHRLVTVLSTDGPRYAPDDLRDFLLTDDALTPVVSVPTALPGVDLGALWAAATSVASRERRYLPEGVRMMIDVDPSGRLADTWYGRRPDLGGDQSAYDAALARLLRDIGVDTAGQIEAIMCRRLFAGVGVDKVDPRRRADYLLRTVAYVDAAAGAGRIPAPPAVPVSIASPAPPSVTRPALPVAVPVAIPAPNDPESDIPVREPDGDWGTRHPDTVEVLDQLTVLLVPESERDVGVSVWGLEHRDHGPTQRGRMVIRLPAGYTWPGGGPVLHRAGQPLKTEWYDRTLFETPRGFRQALERDAMVRANAVGSAKDMWAAVISQLVGHWQRDSTGADLASVARDWLLDYLTGPAVVTTVEADAVELHRSYWVNHDQWVIERQRPRIVVHLKGFVAYAAAQPGGIRGRHGRDLLAYLRVRDTRPWLAGRDGIVKRRAGWFAVEFDQFDGDEWAHLTDVAHQGWQLRQERSLELIHGEAS